MLVLVINKIFKLFLLNKIELLFNDKLKKCESYFK